MNRSFKCILGLTFFFLVVFSSVGPFSGNLFASPYAVEVVAYEAGSNAAAGYTDPSSALGEPSRTSMAWPSGMQDVTVFNAPWESSSLVSIGAGGYLIVKFDHNIIDNPQDVWWGIDFIVFGNAFYLDSSYPNGIASGIYEEPARIAVSQDGINWFDVEGVFADSNFPTQGYIDTSSAYGSDGSIPSDFTIPVDPDFNPIGKSYSEIILSYGGSGGGTGVDFSSTGLSWIRYVKIYQDPQDSWSAEIDAFADVVPEPVSLWLVLAGGVAGLVSKRVI